MNICLLTHTFPRFPGDTAAPFMEGVANSLVNKKNKVFVLTPYSPKFKKIKSLYKLVTYKYIFPDFLHKIGYSETLTDDRSLKTLMVFLSPFLIIFGIIKLYKLVKKEKIDIIHVHWILPNGFIAAVVSFLTDVRIVCTLPGSDVYMAKKNWVYKMMTILAIKRASAITSNSPQLLSDLSKISNLPKTQVIFYGVNTKKFCPNIKYRQLIRKELSINEKEIVVLCIARLVEKKGIKYLIEGFSKLGKNHKTVKLVIVGDGDQKDQLIAQSEKLKIISSCHFIGTVDYDRLGQYYNLADVFILPSIRDSEGNLDDQSVSVAEAMASGNPIIVTDLPGYRSLLETEENGLFVRQKNVMDIRDQLSKLISSDNLRNKLSKNTRKLAITKLNWKHIGNQYNDLFKEIMP